MEKFDQESGESGERGSFLFMLEQMRAQLPPELHIDAPEGAADHVVREAVMRNLETAFAAIEVPEEMI